MADNQMTVEQLLMGLGQAMLQMSKKLDTLAEKLDSVREEIAGTATGAAPGEGFFEAQFGRVEEALTRLASREDSGPGAVDQAPLTEALAKLDSSMEAMSRGLGEKLDSVREAVGKASAETPVADQAPVTEGLAKIDASIEAMSRGLGEKFDGLVSGLAGRESGNSIEELGGRFTELGERVEKALGEVGATVKETGERNAAGITGASAAIIEAINTLPESVKAMGTSLEEKADRIGKDTAETLKKIEGERKKTEKALEEIDKTEKKTGKAVEAVRQELASGLESHLKLLGEMREVTERFAGKAMEDGISLLNRSAIHHYNIGEYGAAAEDLKEAINLDGNRAELWCNLAHAQAASEEVAEAEASFRKALELQPDLDQAVSGLGVLLLAGGRAGESISFLEGFMGNETPSIRTMIAYSRALAAEGRHSDAVGTLETALSLAPDNPEVKAELAAYSGEQGS